MLEDIVRVPYNTLPFLKKFEEDCINRIPNQRKLTEKIKEFKNQGTNIFFQTEDCTEKKLVSTVCSKLQLLDTDSIFTLGFQMEEDIAVLHNGKIVAIFFAFPSSWNPGDKQNYTLDELHKPVADGDRLRASSDGIWTTISGNNQYRRYVWTIQTGDALSMHPSYERKVPDTIDDLWLRLETQTTVPVSQNETVAFVVNNDVYKLTKVFENDTDKNLILNSLYSMSDSVLKYKNLEVVKNILRRTYG